MEGPKDDLKWFGEGFDGFPKRLPEDCVEYMLFIINDQLNQKALLARLEEVRKEASKLGGKLLKEYIWQREEFALELELKSPDGLQHLHGLTNYGDSVEDEWLIVFLLKELSKSFDDLWIKVVDTDGEFLLIEAANALPRWLNPEIADNRVWIHDDKLRIVPLTANQTPISKKTAHISRSLSTVEAHNIISKDPLVLIHSPLVEAEAFYRIRNYPNQINSSLHYAQVTIPRKLVYLIHDCPASIAPAVEAFYLRDPIALKPLQDTTGKTTLTFPPTDLVTTSLKFTKVLYAQLKSQQFSPLPAWKPLLSSTGDTSAASTDSTSKHARLELGMKVTSGFEMLLNDPQHRDNRSVRSLKILLSDLDDPADSTALPSDAEITSWKDATRADSDSWLDINFEDFERELGGKTGKKGAFDFNTKDATDPASFAHENPGFGDAKTQADLRKIVERFEAFMNDEDAGAEGAEVDEMDIDDDNDDDDDSEEDDDDSEDEDKEVSFNEKEFQRMMREMMGLPSEQIDEDSNDTPATSKGKSKVIPRRVEELDSDDEDEEDSEDEAEEMRKIMARMEAELTEAGALDLNPTPRKLSAFKSKSKTESNEKLSPASGSNKAVNTNASSASNKVGSEKGKEKEIELEEDSEESEEEDGRLDIDINLARNLLASFGSQAGLAGPGGNMLGMLGLQLPRDEGSDDDKDVIRAGERGRRIE